LILHHPFLGEEEEKFNVTECRVEEEEVITDVAALDNAIDRRKMIKEIRKRRATFLDGTRQRAIKIGLLSY
jgi:hypothetical protein